MSATPAPATTPSTTSRPVSTGASDLDAHAERRRQILASAAALFDSRGYNHTSMGALAQAVGIAKPTLYHYFTSKEEVLYLLHQEFISLLMSRQAARLGHNPEPADELRAVMRDILELMHTHRGHVRVFFEHHRELPPEWGQAVREQRDAYFAGVEATVRRGIDTGRLRALDARLATLALFGMCNWAYQWYQPGGPLPPGAIADRFFDLFMQGAA